MFLQQSNGNWEVGGELGILMVASKEPDLSGQSLL